MTSEVVPAQLGTATDDVEVGRMERETSIPASADTLRGWVRADKINYRVKQFHILRDVECAFPPGRLVALMGSSGAGKTTLLSALSSRGTGKVTGDLTLNRRPVSRALMKRVSKLVPQDDILEPVLTARQTLRYAADLALDAPLAERHARVEEVIDMLSLSECADVVVGGPLLKGLSGGQRKRVSIGMELLNNPSILFLDEPTSGLDSKTAEDVVDTVKALARGGRTVVCTIHQPSYQVFEKFDWLVMLDKGRVAYNGRIDQVTEYMDEVGAPCPTFLNPADHFLNMMSMPPPGGAEHFGALFADSSFKALADTDSDQQLADRNAYLVAQADEGAIVKEKNLAVDGDDSSSAKSLGNASGGGDDDLKPATSSLWQFQVIARRALHVSLKDRGQFTMRIVQLTVMGSIIGTLFFRMPNDQDRVQDKVSVLFLLMLFLAMSSIMQTAMIVAPERALVHREINNNLYNALPYFFGRVSVLILIQSVFAIFLCTVTYYMVGLRSAPENFFTFLAIEVIISSLAGAMGFAAGLALPSVQAVAAIVPVLILPMTLMSGLFIPLSSIPVYWVWLYYLSPFAWGLSLLMINEYAGNPLNACSPEAFTTPGLCPFGSCNPLDPLIPQECPGEIVLVRYDYDPDDEALSFAVLLAMLVAVLALGLFNMFRMLRKMR